MKQVINTENAPPALGPYSQAVRVQGGNLLFCSGQIALDPKTGELVGESAADQCRQAMENLGAVLKAAGADLTAIVKTTIFLSDMGDFSSVNEVYGNYFDADPPARVTVECGRLPKGARIEIDAVAILS